MTLTLRAAEEDHELARRAARGDLTAVETIFRRYSHMVHRLAFRVTGCQADADDVVQDVFVALPDALARTKSGTHSRRGS